MALAPAKKLKAPHCWLPWKGSVSSSVIVPKAPPDGYTVATEAFTGCSAVLTESSYEGYFQLWHHGHRLDKPECGSRTCASNQIVKGFYYPEGAKDHKGIGTGYKVIKDVTPEVLCSQKQKDLTEPDLYVLHTKKCAHWQYKASKWNQVVTTQTTRVPTQAGKDKGLEMQATGECKFLTAGSDRKKYPDTKTPEDGGKCEVSEGATYTAHSLFYNEWHAQSQYQPMYADGAYAPVPGYAFDHAPYGYVSRDPYAAAGAGAGYMDPSSVMLMMFSVLFVMIVCVLCCFMNAGVGFAAYMMGKAGSGSGSGPDHAMKPKYVCTC